MKMLFEKEVEEIIEVLKKHKIVIDLTEEHEKALKNELDGILDSFRENCEEYAIENYTPEYTHNEGYD